MNLHHLLGSVERVESLDAPAAATSRIAGRLIERTRLAGALRGSWLGHPVHPLLVTIPVGTWMTSAVFDLLFKDITTARRLIAVGLAATPPTVLAGWADYSLLDRRQQRVGLVHAASNDVGVTMFLAFLSGVPTKSDPGSAHIQFPGPRSDQRRRCTGWPLVLRAGRRHVPLAASTRCDPPQPARIPARRLTGGSSRGARQLPRTAAVEHPPRTDQYYAEHEKADVPGQGRSEVMARVVNAEQLVIDQSFNDVEEAPPGHQQPEVERPCRAQGAPLAS